MLSQAKEMSIPYAKPKPMLLLVSASRGKRQIFLRIILKLNWLRKNGFLIIIVLLGSKCQACLRPCFTV